MGLGNGIQSGVEPSQKAPFPIEWKEEDKIAAKAARPTNAEILFNPVRSQYIPKLEVQYNLSRSTNNASASGGGNPSSADDSANIHPVRWGLINSEKMSVCFRRVAASSLADELSSLTGLRIKVESKDASTIISYSGKGLTFGETMSQVSTQSGVRFLIEQ